MVLGMYQMSGSYQILFFIVTTPQFVYIPFKMKHLKQNIIHCAFTLYITCLYKIYLKYIVDTWHSVLPVSSVKCSMKKEHPFPEQAYCASVKSGVKWHNFYSNHSFFFFFTQIALTGVYNPLIAFHICFP